MKAKIQGFNAPLFRLKFKRKNKPVKTYPRFFGEQALACNDTSKLKLGLHCSWQAKAWTSVSAG